MRYRTAEHSVRVLARTLYDLTSDIHPALREGTLDVDTTARWRERAARTGSLIAQARADLNTAEESVHYNPRRLLKRYRDHLGCRGHQSVLDALERTLYQLASLTRSLDQWRAEENDYRYGPFLDPYAAFLEALSEIALAAPEWCRSGPSFGRVTCPLRILLQALHGLVGKHRPAGRPRQPRTDGAPP